MLRKLQTETIIAVSERKFQHAITLVSAAHSKGIPALQTIAIRFWNLDVSVCILDITVRWNKPWTKLMLFATVVNYFT